jgi:ribosomal-protein-alanine N-acetyltransferase
MSAGAPRPAYGRVVITRPGPDDEADYLRAVAESASLHHPWVYPATDAAGFAAYLRNNQLERYEGFFLREREAGALVGVANLNDIVRGALQCAFIGYYAFAGFAGKGYMVEGVAQVLDQAFGPLGLHRIEANVQPENRRSLALVRRLGFRREGFSTRYLKVGGRWRDHERWALLAEDWQR